MRLGMGLTRAGLTSRSEGAPGRRRQPLLGLISHLCRLGADIMSGPGAPVSKALLWCGWRVLPIDILLGPTHDLSNATRQALLHEQLQEADCIMAALDCSTKSRAREIPLHFSDGRPSPKPLRSNDHPEGLPPR